MKKKQSKTVDADAVRAAAEKYQLEDQIGFRLRVVNQRATEIFSSVMGEFDLTTTQFAALAKVDDLGPVSQNLLGRHTAMDPATIYGVVGRLMKRGLVRQRKDADDARLRLIELTDEGQELITQMKAVAANVSKETLAPLTAAEARTFLALLAKLE